MAVKIVIEAQIGVTSRSKKISGLRKLFATKKKVQRAALVGVEIALNRVAADLLSRSAGVAPILTGDLIRSGRVTGDTSRLRVTRFVTYGTDHAVFAHEQITPFGPFGLGPISSKKPSTSDGVVGGGFLLRPFNIHREKYAKSIIRRAKFDITKAFSKS